MSFFELFSAAHCHAQECGVSFVRSDFQASDRSAGDTAEGSEDGVLHYCLTESSVLLHYSFSSGKCLLGLWKNKD